jgi:NHL repeat
MHCASLLLLALLPLYSALADIEVIAGAPKTEAVSEPFSVDFDSKGTLYGVEFTKSNRVFKLADGKLSFIAGVQYNSDEKSKAAVTNVGDGADPQQARFKGMHDIQIYKDSQAIIGDSFHNRVRLLDLASGKVSTIAGTGKGGFGGDGGPATAASFSITMTASLAPDQSHYLIADIGNHRTRRVDLASGLVTTVAGNGQRGLPVDGSTALEAEMGDTRAVCEAKDGTIYILLRGGNSLVELREGKLRTVVNAGGKSGYSVDNGPAAEAKMNGPKYVAMDPTGRVLICDTENHCLRRYDPKAGTIERIAGHPPKAGSELGKTWLDTALRRPHGVRIAPDGSLYIADTYNNRVLRGEYR